MAKSISNANTHQTGFADLPSTIVIADVIDSGSYPTYVSNTYPFPALGFFAEHAAVSSSAGVLTLDMQSRPQASFSITLTENVTSVVISNTPSAGQNVRAVLYLEIDAGAGGFTFDQGSWPAGCTFSPAWNPVLTAAAINHVAVSTIDGGTTRLVQSDSSLSLSSIDAITPDAVRSTAYEIVAGDNVNGAVGTVNVFTGTTNTVNVNTGLGTYAAATPLEFLLWNQGSGSLTVAGSATVNVPTGKTAVVASGGMALLRQSATDVFSLAGELVAA